MNRVLLVALCIALCIILCLSLVLLRNTSFQAPPDQTASVASGAPATAALPSDVERIAMYRSLLRDMHPVRDYDDWIPVEIFLDKLQTFAPVFGFSYGPNLSVPEHIRNSKLPIYYLVVDSIPLTVTCYNGNITGAKEIYSIWFTESSDYEKARAFILLCLYARADQIRTLFLHPDGTAPTSLLEDLAIIFAPYFAEAPDESVFIDPQNQFEYTPGYANSGNRGYKITRIRQEN